MKVLDLFSGIGGFSLGLHRAGMETVAFCEIEPYPQAVLRKNFPGVPIYDDIRTLTAARLAADGIDTIDLICGGFPCQPFSVAGQQRGKDDHRHLWPEMYRLVQECRPTWVIGENVAGFIDMALSEVCADLESAGYEVQPFVIPACAVNAPHRRDRVWIVAHAACRNDRGIAGEMQGEDEQQEVERQKERLRSFIDAGASEIIADTESWELRDVCKNIRSECGEVNAPHNTGRSFAGDDREERQTAGYTDGAGCKEQHTSDLAARSGQHTGELIATGPDWTVESPFCGVADGISRRVDRLKALGNSVVPQIPEVIGRAIMAITNQTTKELT